MVWAWISVLVRSGLIMAGANLLCRLSRKSAPVYRHRIVALSFALLLAWPVVSALLPEIPIQLWPHRMDGVVTVTQTMHFLMPPARPALNVNWPLLVWLFGASISLLPVLIGHIKIRRMIRAASPIEDAGWQMLLTHECERLRLRHAPELLVCGKPTVPLTFGVLRPRIQLSADCLSWPVSTRQIVLRHELMHVRRRDLMWQMVANIATAIWWFQPLCWINRGRLRRESEAACDAWMLASGIRASDYASELLNIAQVFRRWRAGFPGAIAITQRGDLEGRIRAILDSRMAAVSKFPILKFLLLAGLTVSVSTVAVFPNQNDFQGGHSMKRTLISGLLISAGLTAATIGGSVYDPSGAAVSNAQASIYNPDTGMKQETATAADGKFTFLSLPAGSYILHIQKPGVGSLYREFNVEGDSDVQRGLVLKGTADAAGGGAKEKTPAADHLPVGGEVAQANLITKVNPIYPTAAKSAGIQGTIEMEVSISKEGVPEDLRVISSPSDDLTRSALEAVRQWRYRPTLLNGQPVAIVTDVVVNYTLAK